MDLLQENPIKDNREKKIKNFINNSSSFNILINFTSRWNLLL